MAGRFASSALMFLLAAATARAQPATQDLASEFAGRVAAAMAPGATVHLVCTGDDGRTQLDLGRSLAARGIRLAELRDGATTVRCSCLENLREYACIADIGDGAARRVVAATRAKNSGGRSLPSPIVALQLRPLHAQRDPILDVTMAGSALLVLTPTTVTRIPLPEQAAVAPQSAAIATGRVWPRDLRGHLRADGDAFEVFLPGVTCRGSSMPFALACADEGESWPIGIENAGMAASRNTFATPEGFSFYEVAPLDGGQWLVVDQQGTLTFLDAQRRVVARGDATDHVAALRSACTPGSYVVTARRSSDLESADVLRLARVVGSSLVPEASTIALPGVLTALWSARNPSRAQDDREAVAVVHDIQTGRYEAFHLSLSCAR
ncbi:MAG TPA: hypothetical protein VK504_09875 [Vicinamibacterales bacterium]|nr:hypothetical protein [Vicinamibacterales bacterium]